MTEPICLDRLREEWPDFEITERWQPATAGPDTRILQAQRGDVVVTAFTAADLERAMRQSG